VGIREILKKKERSALLTSRLDAPAPRPLEPELKGYESTKRGLHQKILRELDVRKFDPLRDPDTFRALVEQMLAEELEVAPLPLNRQEKDRLTEDLIQESLGMGPLAPLLADPTIDDVLVNGPDQVLIERFGRLEKSSVRFQDSQHLLQLIERIVSRVGRHIDNSSPMVDARLPDGSRINAVIPPLSLVGPVLSIRRFGRGRFSDQELIRLGTLTPRIRDVLEALVRTRTNILVSGSAGSGKTTLLNMLSAYISPAERILTIEDAAELQLRQEHVVRMESRPPNVEGRGAITIRDLVINALRMRPDRIVVGEVRGGEAFDMLHAMTTGHAGGMTTVHANSPRDVVRRLETMVLMSGMDLPVAVVRDLIGSGIEVILHVDRMKDGSRRLTRVTEMVGVDAEGIRLQDIFEFRVSEARESKVVGRHVATGAVPQFLKKLELHGHSFERALFEKDAET